MTIKTALLYDFRNRIPAHTEKYRLFCLGKGPSMPTLKCPGCGRKLKVSNKAIGRRITCPACEKQFDVRRPAPVETPEANVEHHAQIETPTGSVPRTTSQSSTNEMRRFLYVLFAIKATYGALYGAFYTFGRIYYKDWAKAAIYGAICIVATCLAIYLWRWLYRQRRTRG